MHDEQDKCDLLDAPAKAIEVMHIMARDRPTLVCKEHVHVRVHSLPYCMDTRLGASNPTIGGIRAMHIGKLLTIEGTVISTSSSRVFEAHKMCECNECHYRYACSRLRPKAIDLWPTRWWWTVDQEMYSIHIWWLVGKKIQTHQFEQANQSIWTVCCDLHECSSSLLLSLKVCMITDHTDYWSMGFLNGPVTWIFQPKWQHFYGQFFLLKPGHLFAN